MVQRTDNVAASHCIFERPELCGKISARQPFAVKKEPPRAYAIAGYLGIQTKRDNCGYDGRIMLKRRDRE
jgi:hypothetical protein